MKNPKTRRKRPCPAPPVKAVDRLGRDVWIDAAKTVLIARGIAHVKVDPLAKILKVTTGSFYWHFKDRQALLDALLEHWETHNSVAFFNALRTGPEDPLQRFAHLARVWLDEDGYSSAYDSAVRDWARTSPAAEAAVRRVDNKRIAMLHKICKSLGDPEPYAFIRARIMYFHQVGYYAMRISESSKERHSLFPVYISLLAGRARELDADVTRKFSDEDKISVHDK